MGFNSGFKGLNKLCSLCSVIKYFAT